MKIYNTLKQRKENFSSLEEKKVKMYACGITPYDESHLGHGMQAIIFDTIRRYLEYKGYDVKYVRNYTDIDDKIIERAKNLNINPLDLSKKYTLKSKEDLKRLKVKEATFEPLVSNHIDDIIKFIENLINKNYAYESNGSVYFKVSEFSEYGKLSNRTVEDLKQECVFGEEKESSYDFALWKKSKEGEIAWDSPWGKGRPGWHIECSVLSQKYLGEQIDIHGGGRDLVFPHHENELAQSEAKTGKKFVNYWVHNGLITINKQKMSKSSGNFYTIQEVTEKYSIDLIRFLIFSFSYSSNINFDERELLALDKKLYNFYNLLSKLKFLNEVEEKDFLKIKNAGNQFLDSFEKDMDDNFNTPRVIASINQLFSITQGIINKYINFDNYKNNIEGDLRLKKYIDKVLDPIRQIFSILEEDPREYMLKMQDLVLKRLDLKRNDIELIIDNRDLARKNKDFKKADDLRNKLLDLGLEVLDNPDGTHSWYQKIS